MVFQVLEYFSFVTEARQIIEKTSAQDPKKAANSPNSQYLAKSNRTALYVIPIETITCANMGTARYMVQCNLAVQ